ncbi:hypothetical protein NL50_03545 [Clostridium acetobutylicum]|nr:hypothetical protein NL50_03545 [Clostridium acetobutylicum]
MRKSILAIVLILLSLIGYSKGKVEEPPNVSTKNRDVMLNYIEKKYGKKFVFKDYYNIGEGKKDNSKAIFYPKEDKTKRFTVYKVKEVQDVKENGKDVIKTVNTYEDDYALRLIESIVDKKIKNSVGIGFPSFKYASYITTYGPTKGKYTNKVDYDEFIAKEGQVAHMNIVIFVNYEKSFDKHKEAEESYSFIKKIIDSKLIKSPMELEAKFYYLNERDYKKINARKNKYDFGDYMMGEHENTQSVNFKYRVQHFLDLKSKDGINYNQDVLDIENKIK